VFTELTTGVLAPPFVDPQLTNGTRHQYRHQRRDRRDAK
jgi:hypothetical protein